MFKLFYPLLFEIPFLENTLLFTFTMIVLFTILGMGSRSLTVASYSGFLIFFVIAVNIDLEIITQSLYVGLVVIIVITAMKGYNMMFASEGEI